MGRAGAGMGGDEHLLAFSPKFSCLSLPGTIGILKKECFEFPSHNMWEYMSKRAG